MRHVKHQGARDDLYGHLPDQIFMASRKDVDTGMNCLGVPRTAARTFMEGHAHTHY